MKHLLLIAALGIGAPSLALAQQGHSHAAPNGGQIVEIGKFEVELVATPRDVTLYLTDEKEQKVPSDGFEATATVLAAGNKQTKIDLKPAGENRLLGAYDFPVTGKFRATVDLRRGGAEAGRGRFSLDIKR